MVLPCFYGLGSSPLARGTLWPFEEQLRRAGLIPARAGNTVYQLFLSLSNRAHPRSRGEHDTFTFSHYTIPGSSPLARGTPNKRDALHIKMGLIPARAGNTGL